LKQHQVGLLRRRWHAHWHLLYRSRPRWRVAWFLAAYYFFIPVRLVLKTRGAAVLRAANSPEVGMA
jgi:hypothetical protein